jgi:hypothetical protein
MAIISCYREVVLPGIAGPKASPVLSRGWTTGGMPLYLVEKEGEAFPICDEGCGD